MMENKAGKFNKLMEWQVIGVVVSCSYNA